MVTIILASLFSSFYFIHIAKIPSAIKTGFKLKPHQRIKPIDCFSCLPVWVAMILYCLPEIVSIMCIIFFGAGCIANAILYILNKLP